MVKNESMTTLRGTDDLRENEVTTEPKMLPRPRIKLEVPRAESWFLKFIEFPTEVGRTA